MNHPTIPLIAIGKETANSKDEINPARVPANNLTSPKITNTVNEIITNGKIIVKSYKLN